MSQSMLVLWAVLAVASAEVDYCAQYKYPRSELSSKLQFTKELTESEFADDAKLKSLHCCSKGYRSIEWFKDDVPYPWSVEVSNFILYPESANQTIYTLRVRGGDAGRYTCKVRNDSRTIEHSTELTVFDKGGYMEKPLWTHQPEPFYQSALGCEARLFCEAFVGYIDLPDAINEVVWEKMGNVSFINNPRIHVRNTQREAGEVVGAYLIIEDVQWTDFGTYTCTISNTGDQCITTETILQALSDNLTPMCLWGKASLVIGSVILLVVSTCAACIIKYLSKQNENTSSIMQKIAHIKNIAESPFTVEKTLKKSGGLVLIYKNEDTEFVEKILIPGLIEKSPYNIFPHHVTNDGSMPAEAKDMLNKVGRQLIVFTPNIVKAWTQPFIVEALQTLVTSHQHCILLIEPFPSIKPDRSNFDSFMKRYTVVGWPESGDTLEAKTATLVETITSKWGKGPLRADEGNNKTNVATKRPNILSKFYVGKRSDIPEVHV